MAHDLGRKRKKIALTFGRDDFWNGTPPLRAFEFFNRFREAIEDNDLSAGRAMYRLTELTRWNSRRTSCP